MHGCMGENLFLAGQLEETTDFQIPLLQALSDNLQKDSTVICDFGPGNGTDVSFGLKNMDLALMVLLPVPGWKQHLTSMLSLFENSSMRIGLIINKVKDETGIVSEIEVFCANHSLPFLGCIPFDSNIAYTGSDLSSGKGASAKLFSGIWSSLAEWLPSSVSFQKNATNK